MTNGSDQDIAPAKTTLTWIGIGVCLLQSGTFSGLNLAVFGINSLRLEAQAATGNKDAARLRDLRQDSNFLLTTILWGNVGTNVLLTLLSESILAGAAAFLFSTFVITFGGEIIPQAYFSRNALRMASLLRPVLRFWQFVLFPLAKPTAFLLDAWLGKEGLQFLRENELREALKRYAASPDSEMSRVEGIGALNFLCIDDLQVSQEGEVMDPKSILSFPSDSGRPVLPEYKQTPDDPFLQQVEASGQRWVILTSTSGDPLLALEADGFLRAAVFARTPVNILAYCHRPIVVRDGLTPLGEILPHLKVHKEHLQDDVIDHDLILYWGHEKRVITGADLLGRLMRGIPRQRSLDARKPDTNPEPSRP